MFGIYIRSKIWCAEPFVFDDYCYDRQYMPILPNAAAAKADVVLNIFVLNIPLNMKKRCRHYILLIFTDIFRKYIDRQRKFLNFSIVWLNNDEKKTDTGYRSRTVGQWDIRVIHFRLQDDLRSRPYKCAEWTMDYTQMIDLVQISG